MAGGMEVGARVAARALVATPDVPTRLATPQMQPRLTHRKALLAPLGRRLDGGVGQLVHMSAGRHSIGPLSARTILRVRPLSPPQRETAILGTDEVASFSSNRFAAISSLSR